MRFRPGPWAALALAAALRAAPGYAPTPGEQAFIERIDKEHRPIEARELAKAYVAQHPGSFLACEVIGMVYLHTDGDLPKALYWLTRARRLLESRWEGRWGPGTPTGNYSATLEFLYQAQYRMERYEDALATLSKREEIFTDRYPSSYAWPLMKMGRYREARAKIAEALASGNAGEATSALNTLGALESELDRPEEAYSTQTRLLDYGKSRTKDPTLLRNAADSALTLGLTAQCERLLLEATERFDPGTVSNPWGDLAGLYLLEARYGEAMDAVKRMHLWAIHTSPLQAQTHWNVRQTLTAGLLFYCGCTDEALAIAKRIAERPDRHAMGSSRTGQAEAGSGLFLCMALQDALARDAEAFSYASWKQRPALLLRRAGHQVAYYLALRRTGALLMESRERFSQSLRMLAPQSIGEVPGGEVLLPRIAGPGIAEAEIRSLLARPGAPAQRERPFLLVLLGAARVERGDTRGALEALDQAAPALPPEFVLLHTQLQALRAKALLARGDRAGAMAALAFVLQHDDGEVRRMGLGLPCTLQGADPLAGKAVSMLASSPRLLPGRGGFRIQVESTGGGGLRGSLADPQGAILCQFQVPRGADADATARALCAQFHKTAFGPRIDLSQQQIRSLEGSTLASQSAEEQLKGILGD